MAMNCPGSDTELFWPSPLYILSLSGLCWVPFRTLSPHTIDRGSPNQEWLRSDEKHLLSPRALLHRGPPIGPAFLWEDRSARTGRLIAARDGRQEFAAAPHAESSGGAFRGGSPWSRKAEEVFVGAKGPDLNSCGLAMGGCDADAGDDDDADFSFTPRCAASLNASLSRWLPLAYSGGARAAGAPTDAGAVAWTATCSPPRRRAPARAGSALGLIRILPSVRSPAAGIVDALGRP